MGISEQERDAEVQEPALGPTEKEGMTTMWPRLRDGHRRLGRGLRTVPRWRRFLALWLASFGGLVSFVHVVHEFKGWFIVGPVSLAVGVSLYVAVWREAWRRGGQLRGPDHDTPLSPLF